VLTGTVQSIPAGGAEGPSLVPQAQGELAQGAGGLVDTRWLLRDSLSSTDLGRPPQVTGRVSSMVIWHAIFWMTTPPFCLGKGKATGIAGLG